SVGANGTLDLADLLQEPGVVFQAIQQFRIHFEGLQCTHGLGQLLACRVEVAADQVGSAQVPESDRFAALVFRVPAYLERSRESSLRGLQIACAERELAEV